MGKQKHRRDLLKLVHSRTRSVRDDASLSFPVPSLPSPIPVTPCLPPWTHTLFPASQCLLTFPGKDPPFSSTSLCLWLFESQSRLYVILKAFQLVWNFIVPTEDCSLAGHTCKIRHFPVCRQSALGPALNALKSKHQAPGGVHLSPCSPWRPSRGRLPSCSPESLPLLICPRPFSRPARSYVMNMVTLADGPAPFPHFLQLQK